MFVTNRFLWCAECVPELYLPFISDTQDQSGRQVFVKNEGVQVRDGKAFFDGKSRLTVPRFSNTWWGSTVYVHLRYKSALTSTRRLALVSNGDCQVRPSLAVCAGPAGVEFYAETENSPQPVNFTVSTFDQVSEQGLHVLAQPASPSKANVNDLKKKIDVL